MRREHALALLVLAALAAPALGQPSGLAEFSIEDRYEKFEHRIPMRDGVRLFTSVYVPREIDEPVPILMSRTPYSVRSYGPSAYPRGLGPHPRFAELGYVFVYQDVRGRNMSEGDFVNMTPHLAEKRGPGDIDESTDTWDTIEWLLANVEGHNGRVGLWGISYRGFYAAASMIDAHPALVAVSPQAPIADWYFEDFHHRGAFCLATGVNFFSSFGRPRPEPTSARSRGIDHGTPDGYRFFLDLGPLSNVNERHFHGTIAFWNDMAAHPDYDEFWRRRNILPHLRNVAPAVMTVGGWFDLENLYGALHTYQAIEAQDADAYNILVMGPWFHGGWTRSDGERLGDVSFGAPTSAHYRAEIDVPFFEHFLRGADAPDLPEAYVFETGTNAWRAFDAWPPAGTARTLHLHADGRLDWTPPTDPPDAADAFVSDPARPVPYETSIATGPTRPSMTADQRFASRRPDVLVYETAPLEAPITLAGPIEVALNVSTTGTDADWIVKVIDVFPDDAPHDPESSVPMAGYQMLVRAEAMRGRYRDGFDRPLPFLPGDVTEVEFPLQDVLHTFRPGHRIMVQIQSTWFPFIDRNPQTFVDNIFEARAEDYLPATHRVHRSARYGSSLRVNVIPGATAADSASD